MFGRRHDSHNSCHRHATGRDDCEDIDLTCAVSQILWIALSSRLPSLPPPCRLNCKLQIAGTTGPWPYQACGQSGHPMTSLRAERAPPHLDPIRKLQISVGTALTLCQAGRARPDFRPICRKLMAERQGSMPEHMPDRMRHWMPECLSYQMSD